MKQIHKRNTFLLKNKMSRFLFIEGRDKMYNATKKTVFVVSTKKVDFLLVVQEKNNNPH